MAVTTTEIDQTVAKYKAGEITAEQLQTFYYNFFLEQGWDEESAQTTAAEQAGIADSGGTPMGATPVEGDGVETPAVIGDGGGGGIGPIPGPAGGAGPGKIPIPKPGAMEDLP